MPSPAFIRCLALALLAGAGVPGRAASDCDAPPETWQPRSAVQALAERNGWQVDRVKIDDGCYEIRGRDAEGRPFKAKVDPASMQVVHLRRGEPGLREPDRDRARDHARERERDRRAASRPDPSPPSLPSLPSLPSSSGVRP